MNQIDQEFNMIINVNVRIDIANAFLLLDSNLKKGLITARCEEERKKLLLKKASQCKMLLNEYIDSLVKLILKTDCEKDIEK